MSTRRVTVEGRTWMVTPSGRRTQYGRDELGLVFTSLDEAREQRICRFSPAGATGSMAALDELSEPELANLLRRSQPSWTSPDLGYRR